MGLHLEPLTEVGTILTTRQETPEESGNTWFMKPPTLL